MPAPSLLFFFVIERSVYMYMGLVFYYNGMIEMVTMQITQQFLNFSLLPKEPN